MQSQSTSFGIILLTVCCCAFPYFSAHPTTFSLSLSVSILAFSVFLVPFFSLLLFDLAWCFSCSSNSFFWFKLFLFFVWLSRCGSWRLVGILSAVPTTRSEQERNRGTDAQASSLSLCFSAGTFSSFISKFSLFARNLWFCFEVDRITRTTKVVSRIVHIFCIIFHCFRLMFLRSFRFCSIFSHLSLVFSCGLSRNRSLNLRLYDKWFIFFYCRSSCNSSEHHRSSVLAQG